MGIQLAPTKGEAVKLYIRTGPYQALREAVDRNPLILNPSTSEDLTETKHDFGLQLVFGQQILEVNNKESELCQGTWIIHHSELFEDMTMAQLRKPLKFRSRVKHRIEMLLQALSFGWKLDGWQSWDSNYDLSEIEFLGVMIVDRHDHRLERRSQIISGVAGLVEDLYDDILSDFDPQRVCILQSEHNKYEFNYVDINQYQHLKDEQPLKLYSVKKLGDIAMANWINGRKVTPTEDDMEEVSAIKEFTQDSILPDRSRSWRFNLHSPTESEPLYMKNLRKCSAELTAKALLSMYSPGINITTSSKKLH